MLAILNGPMPPKGIEQLPGSRFMFPKAAEGKTDIMGCFPDLPFAHVLTGGRNAQQASRARQTEVGGIDRAMPDPVGGDSPVVFFSPLQ